MRCIRHLAAGVVLISALVAVGAHTAVGRASAQVASGLLGSNLIQNPGFEQWSGENPDGWQVQDWSNRTLCSPVGNPPPCGNPYQETWGNPTSYPVVAQDSKVSHGGTYSAMMQMSSGGAEPRLDTTVTAPGPRTYTISYWVRTTGASQATVSMFFGYYRDLYADTWHVPGDGSWYQVVGSDYIPKSQTGTLFALRDETPGQPVWLDDAALQVLPFNVFPVSLGSLHAGQNAATFRIQALEDVPAGLTFQMAVTDPSGATNALHVNLPAIAAGQDDRVSVPYVTATPGTYHLDPSILQGTQTIWHVMPSLQHPTDPATPNADPYGFPDLAFTLPNTLSTSLVEPHYRAAIYQTDPTSSIIVRAQLVTSDSAPLTGYTYTAQLMAAGGSVIATTPRTSPMSSTFTVSFPASLLPVVPSSPPAGQTYAADNYTVAVTANDGQGHTYTSVQPFRKLGPTPDGVEVVRDDHSVIRVDGAPFFPRGLYSANDLPALRAGNFDLVIAGSVPAVGSDEYKTETGMGVRRILALDPTGDGNCTGQAGEAPACLESYLTAKLALVQNDPQVIGFAFGDEYDYDRYAQYAYDFLVDHDPYRIMYESDYDPYNFRNVWRAADVVAVDPYPMYTTVERSVLEVSSKLDEAQQGVDGRATVWDIPQVSGTLPWFQAPTADQLRAMFYLALLHGATGTFGYAGSPGGIYPMPASCQPLAPSEQTSDPNWGLHWYLWCTDLASEYIQLDSEAETMLPVLTSGANSAAAWFMQPQIPTSLDWTVRKTGDQSYLIVQNTDSTSTSATFTPADQSEQDALASQQPAQLVGSGPMTVGPGGLTAAFAPYETRVFVITDAPTAALVSTLVAYHHDTWVRFRWRSSNDVAIAGFNVYADDHRLNHQMIRLHRGHAYRYASRRGRGGRLALAVILTSGRVVRVHAL